MPSPWASARAPTTASGEQQLRAPSVCRSAHSFSVTATTSAPRSRSSSAATAESTPPLSATSTRSPLAGGSASALARRGRARRARGEARRRPARRRGGPAARARRALGADLGRRRSAAASSTLAPSASSATAAPAALAAAQPSASKLRRDDAPRSTASETRTRSPQGAPAGGAAEARRAGAGAAPRVVAQVVLEQPRRPSCSAERCAREPLRLSCRRTPLLRVVRQVRRALVEGVADRLVDAVRAPEAVADVAVGRSVA